MSIIQAAAEVSRRLQDDDVEPIVFNLESCGEELNALESEDCQANILNLTKNETVQFTDFAVVSQDDSNAIWLIVAGALVFFMHAGFSMLEAGSVRRPNVINIMFKNIGTVAIGAVFYWALGFGFGYGAAERGANSFIGNAEFVYTFSEDIDPAFFFFQFTFAATAATIVSGAVAERITLGAYFYGATLITAFVFPVVTHWVWSDFGFMSAFTADGSGILIEGSIGLIDFAGSGVVHATGGVIALVAAALIGPRQGKYIDGVAQTLAPSSATLQTLGTFILWFGWYGFNVGSTLAFDGTNMAKAALTTTLAPSAAGVVGTIVSRVMLGHFDLGMVLNCVLGGLVSITAGCVAVADWAAIIIGAIGALVYIGSAKLIERFGIDDPIGAAPVHGFCGIWGVIAVGIFFDEAAVLDSYGAAGTQGAQFGMQIVGAVIITLWALLFGFLIFLPLKLLNRLRIPKEVEQAGIDYSEHGGPQTLHF